MSVVIGPRTSFDPDAISFFNATEITDITQKAAINQLVLDLKSANIWTKMKAIYPFVGGTSATHKWNLKDPRDLDIAFRLSFFGGSTHSSTGWLPNGTNGYADTYFNTDDVVSIGLQSFGVYLRNNPTFAINTVESPTGLRGGIYWIRMLNTSPTNTNLRSGTRNTNINGVTGFIAQSRSSTTEWYGINNSTITILTNLSSTLSSENVRTFKLGAYENASVVDSFSTQEIAFSFYGEPLLEIEMTYLYTAIQTFQTTLGRNV
jgi:hypothetical protein